MNRVTPRSPRSSSLSSCSHWFFRRHLVEPLCDVGDEVIPPGGVGEEVVGHLAVGVLVVGDGSGDGVIEVGDSENWRAVLTLACWTSPLLSSRA